MRTLREILIEALRNTNIYEMAKSQEKCEKTVLSQINNILENIILLNYFKLSSLKTTNINHWKNELFVAILNAGKFKPKGDNSIERRTRIVKRVFDEEEVKSYDYIYDSVIGKMYTELETQFETNKNAENWFDEAITSTMNIIDDIIELIIKKDNIIIKGWINTTFK